MEIEFSQKVGQTTIKMRDDVLNYNWDWYQKHSEFWQQITEYEISLLPEGEQPGSSFKKLRK